MRECPSHLPQCVIDRSLGAQQDFNNATHYASRPIYCILFYCMLLISCNLLSPVGFTAMCEEFAKRKLGVDILTKTLNDYLGHIQDTVLKAGGDVIEFAGM